MVDLIVFLTLLALGYFFGRLAENRHYRSIIKREQALARIPAIATKIPDLSLRPQKTVLVTGSVVISVDYFKRLLASLRNIFGGTVKSYESLLDRARREALLRMRESAPNAGVIVNVRIETASIGRRANKKGVGCVEAIAYGTALMFRK